MFQLKSFFFFFFITWDGKLNFVAFETVVRQNNTYEDFEKLFPLFFKHFIDQIKDQLIKKLFGRLIE